MFSVSMFPIGSDESILAPVTEVVEEIDRARLRYQATAMDTVIEGEWTSVGVADATRSDWFPIRHAT